MLTLQLPIPYVAANKTAISCTIGAHTPAILPGCHKAYLGGSWLPEKSGCAKILLMVHMRAHGYHIKLQCQKPMKQPTTNNSIYIYE